MAHTIHASILRRCLGGPGGYARATAAALAAHRELNTPVYVDYHGGYWAVWREVSHVSQYAGSVSSFSFSSESTEYRRTVCDSGELLRREVSR